ncbi:MULTISPECIES: hypothetical protein [unclassified Streptomyces]|uniref:hypothetical protein n=1 Tax=unclassified Streptomyces TaxID=2593676 RepID=UPI0022379E01|nr:hypothetical protein [Streptomyces sp. SHP 1-2]MCW5253391.1 hypothetical protein [Streptomyces sp. SHP 1-2]
MRTAELDSYIRRTFAEHSGLSEAELFSGDTTLADVISRSSRMTNSIDLMESFARTANALRKDHGIRVRLPALPLDTPMTSVVKLFLEECERQAQKEESA